MRSILLFLSIVLPLSATGQSYTTWRTGNPADTVCSPSAGICMMGGGAENDQAMKWFLANANGGDVVVLRTSGSDGYNSYMFNMPGIKINSVETILFHSAAASYDPYVLMRISQAEAIWFAGGDQWDYISYWRNTAVDSIIRTSVIARNVVLGGTSAGMAILGGFYFTAQNGTLTSAQALSNPYNNAVTVDSATFLRIPFLSEVITDTHYDNPLRKGRHMVFLARILQDYSHEAKGIACDEYTAVCIDSMGTARVFGQYPDYDDNAWFIQTNCELTDIQPEQCTAGKPLVWNLDHRAVKAYRVKGTTNGTNSFNLSDWESGTGGSWFNWHVDSSGTFHEAPGSAINCPPDVVQQNKSVSHLHLYPNPAENYIRISASHKSISTLIIRDNQGRIIRNIETFSNEISLDINDFLPGLYILQANCEDGTFAIQKFLKQ